MMYSPLEIRQLPRYSAGCDHEQDGQSLDDIDERYGYAKIHLQATGRISEGTKEKG
jgi:hypothetical protein